MAGTGPDLDRGVRSLLGGRPGAMAQGELHAQAGDPGPPPDLGALHASCGCSPARPRELGRPGSRVLPRLLSNRKYSGGLGNSGPRAPACPRRGDPRVRSTIADYPSSFWNKLLQGLTPIGAAHGIRQSSDRNRGGFPVPAPGAPGTAQLWVRSLQHRCPRDTTGRSPHSVGPPGHRSLRQLCGTGVGASSRPRPIA